MKHFASILTALMMLNLVAPRSAHAGAEHIDFLANAVDGKAKKVQFSLIDDSSSTLVLKAGEDIINLRPGESVEVKLPTGIRIVVVESAAQSHKPGDIILETSTTLSGTIVHIR